MQLRILAVLLLLVAACSRSGETASGPDFRTCQGFLDAAEAMQITGLTGLEAEVRSLTGSVQKQQPSIQDFCRTTLYLPGHIEAIAMNAIRYASSEAAREQYQRVRGTYSTTAADRFTEEPLGPDSYAAEVNRQGIGDFVGFLKGTDLFSIQTAAPSGGPPPTTMDQLRQLAQSVRNRLP